MTAVLLVAIGTIFLAIAIWPFGPYQFSLILAHRLRRFPPAPDPARSGASRVDETFAVCLCAYNEAAVIADKVEDLLRLQQAAGGNLEILIYVDAASDDTVSILAPYRESVRLVVGKDRRGKTYGMNLLVAQTRASIVMFTDANVRIEPTAVAVLRRYFADPSIGCVCSNLQYTNASQSATAAVGSAFWSFNEWTKGLETMTGSVIGADGSLFAVRRELHRPVEKGLIDDLVVSLGTLSAGYRVVQAPELRVYETHTTAAADEFRRKMRISCQCMHVHFELWPKMRRLDLWNLYKYIGHRLLRWIGGYFLSAAIVLYAVAATLIIDLSTLLVVSGLSLILFLASLRARFSPALQLLNVLLAFAGNAVGAWRAFRGERAITWEPPASGREAGMNRRRATR
jgi:cellulose synthase/poly-beta-1,6-N-acetylglucosamine synthase-like glycosyltransferase